MARGLSREQSLAKNMKKTAASNKGNQEDLSTTARAARDAAAMQEKAAAKAAAKEALAKSGDAGAAQLEAEEAQKAKLKAAAKERKLTSGKAGQASKNNYWCIPLLNPEQSTEIFSLQYKFYEPSTKQAVYFTTVS